MPLRPVEWGPGCRDRVRDWLDYELTAALNYRSGLETRWRKRLEMYRAPADQPLKRFPFEGASNYVLPMIATDVDQMYARLVQTIHAAENIWALAPMNESWVAAAKPMQDFLQLLDSRILKMYNVNKRALLEMVKLGTAIYKTGWHYETRTIGNYSREGPSRVKMTRSIPTVDHVRLVDFLLPSHALAINADEQGGAEWVGERIRMTPERLRALAKATEPYLPNFGEKNVQAIVEFTENDVTLHRQAIRKADYVGTATASGSTSNFDKSADPIGNSSGGNTVRELEIWEIHCRCETRSGQFDEVVLWYHRPTQTLMREVYHHYPFAGRPYDVVRYFPGDGFYGIGMCEQLEMLQAAASETFNFMQDNMLLGNSIGLAVKGGSNIGPGEPIYPGMVKITDGNPRDELMPFKLGDINPGIMQSLDLLQSMAQRRDGIGDLQQGQINDVPGRTPATTIVSLLQEGSRRPDLTIKDLRYEGLANVGMKILQFLQANIAKPYDVGAQQYLKLAVEALGMPEGAEVAQKLMMPAEDVELGLAVALTATTGSANKEINAQRYTALLQMMMQLGPVMMGYAQAATQFPGTLMGQTATNLALGTEALFERVLEQNDIRDPEAIVSPATPPDLGAPGLPPAGAGPGPGAGPEGMGGQPGGPDMGAGAGPPVRGPSGAVGGPPQPR